MSKRKPQVKMILDMERERDAAVAMAEGLREDVKMAERVADSMSATVNDLRKQVEDLRRQRDNERLRAENEALRARTAEANLQRAMGWVDAKMDRPPELDNFDGRPF